MALPKKKQFIQEVAEPTTTPEVLDNPIPEFLQEINIPEHNEVVIEKKTTKKKTTKKKTKK